MPAGAGQVVGAGAPQEGSADRHAALLHNACLDGRRGALYRRGAAKCLVARRPLALFWPSPEPRTDLLLSDLINLPDARRLIFGLRDTGYNFLTAAADIIDNSIAANATTVHVKIVLNSDGRKFVYFADNGDGMSAGTLREAMRYGAPVRPNLASLGKFGLGLKTASSSVCLKFAVITRTAAGNACEKLAWDLEHVGDTNSWEMLQEPVAGAEKDRFDSLCGDHGTLVVWSKCDRLLSKEYENPGGSKEQQAINRIAESLKDHISLVYYRFLSSEDKRQRNVSIFVNGESVKPWNPFYPGKAEQVLSDAAQLLEIEREDGTVETATVRAWILPNSRDLSPEEVKIARISNHAQGFYIHREGRVIQRGGWLGVFGSVEPHTSTLRVEFDFDHRLDDAFRVDVKKSRILFDPALEEALKQRLQSAYREAGNRYRRREKDANVRNGIDHDSANNAIERTATKGPSVASVAVDNKSATISNNHGPSIKLRVPVDNSGGTKNVFVDAVETITSGNLWEPALRKVDGSGFKTAVKINKHHEFYQKIYQRAGASGYAVEGMDLLLWAFSLAELNNSNSDLEPIFEDIREEVSTNLKKLLRDLPLPDDVELGVEQE